MFFNITKRPSIKTIVSAAASVAATAMVIRSIAQEYLPCEVKGYVALQLRTLMVRFSNELTLVIEEYDDGLNQNNVFKAAKLYLEPKIPPYVKRIKINLPNKDKENKLSCSVEKDEEIVDFFNGVQLKWKFVSKQAPREVTRDPDNYNSVVKTEDKLFELSFHKKHKQMVLHTYIPYVLKKSKEISNQKKTLKLFTLSNRMHGGGDLWRSVNLDHPATFDTLAMDSDMKKMIMDDLERFLKRKEFYSKVGKAWKRGYLLFGPPGTGKSSLIAAMANYLNFDVYDLELSNLRNNMELRHLLIPTENKSILVVEDIDCSIESQDRLVQVRAGNPLNQSVINLNQGPKVTLSGLLNFIDGLWSSCGDERIIVFTTNHKDRLDPALLRPGRMDVHIHMSYCTPCGFKMLASNYHGITEHPLFSEIEELIEKSKVTPADVAEQLLRNEVPEVALRGLIEFLKIKKREINESKSEEAKEERSEEADSSIQANKGKANGISQDLLKIQ